jgi:UDP-2-acetamido-3-amino-2,3-dideoxy-glucuronate N-acetyltransferase
VPRNDPDKDYKPTLVKRGATLGANSTVVCGHTIGEYAFVGAGSVVTRDVPAHAMVYGNPARIRGWACSCGLRITDAGGTLTCPECGAHYQLAAGDRLETLVPGSR